MQGLLDFIKTPEGQGLLSGVFGYAANARKGTPVNNLGRGGLAGLLGYSNALERQDQQADNQWTKQYRQMQMDEMQRKIAEQKGQQEWRAGLPSMLQKQTMVPNDAGPTAAPDTEAINNYLMDPRSPFADELVKRQLFPKEPDYKTVGKTLLRVGPNGVNPVFSEAPEIDYNKPFLPDGTPNKAYQEFKLSDSKAGAASTNIVPKIEIKTGESLAGQVGPMVKDSRVQTQGAVKMFDAATRLESALASNKVTSGPFATQIQTAKQLIQVVGGGNDEGIRQTRQAIKSLAQMAVEARKQLQGQGQVTESEAAAVAKADAGDINDLTTGELQDLVTLTKRASHFQAQSHSELLKQLSSKPETQGLVNFYNVQGLDPLLTYKPVLPQIGQPQWGIKEVKK